jgi:adenylosuccinate synthase
VGLGYGDEGKGAMVDWLARTTGARRILRFNGGPQAAHHVVTPEGVTHCFSQLGSGAFVPGVETSLSSDMRVDPLALEHELGVLEAKGLRDIRSRLTLDPDCLVVTPWHAWLNQMIETARGARAHGSCGRGLGQVLADQLEGRSGLRVRDLSHPRLPALMQRLREEKLMQMQDLLASHPDSARLKALMTEAMTPEVPGFLVERYRALLRSGVRLGGLDELRRAVGAGERLICEGAQGALLDMEQGFWPHVTPSRTTAHNARRLLAEIDAPQPGLTLGVMRAYLTRHGQGPLVTEDPALRLPEPHNPDDGWQGPMRYGWGDALATRYAIAINQGVDLLAVTCLDRLAGVSQVRLATAYAPPIPGDPANERFGVMVGDLSGELRPVETGTSRLEARTAWLHGCRPRYQHFPGWGVLEPGRLPAAAAAFLEGLGGRLGKRVSMVSLGPTAKDKLVVGEAESIGKRNGPLGHPSTSLS